MLEIILETKMATIRSHCRRHPEQRLDMESIHDVTNQEVEISIEPCKTCESIKSALKNNLGIMAQTVQSIHKLREALEGIK